MKIRVFIPITVLVLTLILVNLCFIVDSIAVHFSHVEKSEQANLIAYNHLYEQKEILLKENDVIQLDWLRTLNPKVKNVDGKIIWSTNKQSGVIVISGLPKPTKEENYQLWIYDLEKHFSQPVSTSLRPNSFKHANANNRPLIIPFTPNENLDIPYKFELVLERATNDEDQNNSITKRNPLLLAQP